MDEIDRSVNLFKMLKQVMGAIRHNTVNGFDKMNVTGPQGMLIGILIHSEEMKISDLSEKMGLSNSTVSGIIDRLEKQGIVERVRSEKDRRVVLVSVTEEFRKISKKHFNEIEKRFESIMKEATQEEVEKVSEGLSILKRLLERYNQQ